jgi:hypothetical protein
MYNLDASPQGVLVLLSTTRKGTYFHCNFNCLLINISKLPAPGKIYSALFEKKFLIYCSCYIMVFHLDNWFGT